MALNCQKIKPVLCKTSFKNGFSVFSALLAASFIFGCQDGADPVSCQDPENNVSMSGHLNSVAYYEISVTDKDGSLITASSNNAGNAIENKLCKAVSAKDTNSIIREELKKIIDSKKCKNSGSNIIWNQEFIENVVRKDYPDFYEEIQKQIEQDNTSDTVLTTGSEKILKKSSGTMGSKNQIISVSAKGWFKTYYTFQSDCYWTFDGTRVTYCAPYTTGYAYEKGYHFKGLTQKTLDYNKNVIKGPNDSYVKWIREGSFGYTSSTVNVQVEFNANGTYKGVKLGGGTTINTSFNWNHDYTAILSFLLNGNGTVTILQQTSGK